MSGMIDRMHWLRGTDSEYLSPKATATRLHLAVGTLANWRVQGIGPRFVKFGKKVLYPRAEVVAYEQRQIRSAT